MTQATPQATPSPVCLYQVEETVAHKLDQLSGTLGVLTGLAGTAYMGNKTASPEFTIKQLHDMLWLMQDSVDSVIDNMTKYPALFHNNERIL